MVAFAVPVFLGQLFQQLYNTADSIIVGNFSGKGALAAVASSGNLIFMLTGFFMGVSLGAGVVISRYFGAKDYKAMEAAVHTTIAFGAVCAVSVIGVVFTAIDFNKFGPISYGAYFLAGWSVLSTVRALHAAFSKEFIILLIAGGLVYTSGMIFFLLEMKKHKYCHSVFHIFIVLGSVLHFIAIFKYCI